MIAGMLAEVLFGAERVEAAAKHLSEQAALLLEAHQERLTLQREIRELQHRLEMVPTSWDVERRRRTLAADAEQAEALGIPVPLDVHTALQQWPAPTDAPASTAPTFSPPPASIADLRREGFFVMPETRPLPRSERVDPGGSP